jgi:hypothetical protein
MSPFLCVAVLLFVGGCLAADAEIVVSYANYLDTATPRELRILVAQLQSGSYFDHDMYCHRLLVPACEFLVRAYGGSLTPSARRSCAVVDYFCFGKLVGDDADWNLESEQ